MQLVDRLLAGGLTPVGYKCDQFDRVEDEQI